MNKDVRFASDGELVYNVSSKVTSIEKEWTLTDFLNSLTPSRKKIAESAIELYKRELNKEKSPTVIRSSYDVYDYMRGLLYNLPIEEFWIIYLKNGGRVIGRERISQGGITYTIVDVRCILREAVLKRAVSIIAVHNHPSGIARPSVEDDKLTERLRIAASTLDIRFIDHTIITDNDYYSYSDNDKLSD
jgi:DNA repair protein RadC